MLQNIIKEPLFHFLFVGFLLFLFFETCSTPSYSADEQTIVVDKEALLTLMQYRSKAFQGDYFEQKFEQLSEAERQQLIADYVQEEALYREAQQLNLSENDYIIKRRMIQKVDFIYQNQIAQMVNFPEDSLQQYFEKHQTQYQRPALYTFSHVFFKAEEGKVSTVLSKAKKFLHEANKQGIDFNQSLQYGERFLYHRHYVEKDLENIKSQFGENFGEQLAVLAVHENKWQGPLESEHGVHLVLLVKQQKATIPSFEDLKSTIVTDYKRLYEQKLKEDLMKNLLEQYEVVLDL